MSSQPATYRVDALASAAGLSVDTVRYYQRRGLLDPPQRIARHSEYTPQHLERLQEIRQLAAAGLTLNQIADLAAGQANEVRPLTQSATLSRTEVADQAGVPESLVALLCDNGLLQPTVVASQPRFSQSEVAMVKAGLAISNAGVPLDQLVALAADHAANIDDIVDQAITLFDHHIKTPADSDEDLVAIIHTLLPAVTRLMAQHFHRTLVSHALARADDGQSHALAEALQSVNPEQLVVTSQWH